jgi:hypothetical protein
MSSTQEFTKQIITKTMVSPARAESSLGFLLPNALTGALILSIRSEGCHTKAADSPGGVHGGVFGALC